MKKTSEVRSGPFVSYSTTYSHDDPCRQEMRALRQEMRAWIKWAAIVGGVAGFTAAFMAAFVTTLVLR